MKAQKLFLAGLALGLLAITASLQAQNTPAAGCKPTSGGDGVRLVELGALKNGEASFTLKPGDISVLFTAIADDLKDEVALLSLTIPGGTSWYSANLGSDEFKSPVFSSLAVQQGELVVYLPLDKAFDLKPGDYKLRVATNSGKPIGDAFVVIRSGLADCPMAIDLNLWVLSGDPQLSTPAGQNAIGQKIRAAVDKILGQQNMRLGKLKFMQSTAEEKKRYAKINSEEESDLCEKLYAKVGGEDIGWNMALVEDAGQGTLGFSPVPGSVLVPDSNNSCAVTAFDTHEGDFDDLGATIVHEGTHFLGMMHTTEKDGKSFDPIGDTPKCPAGQFDKNADGELSADECASAGGTNYIFWNPNPGATGITPGQAWVMRRHPLFYIAP